ncbi:hypothetical protein BC833DRAFT_617371 [Globomyces pollinis-pini]|nr:hypothetical protein BC833DRAFT_617371 [Globomyces pollinis-pini]
MLLTQDIWQKVVTYLPPKDLVQLSRVHSNCHYPAIREMYKKPHIHPLATKQTWRKFVDRIQTKTFCSWIEQCEDVWLFIGGEDKDDDELKSNHDLQKIDSKIDFNLIDLQPTNQFERYSLNHCLSIMMNNQKLKRLCLDFYSESMCKLPWNPCLTYLIELDLGMRITDDILFKLFSSTEMIILKKLTLRRAEISDKSLILFGDRLESLVSFNVSITPISQRSRYHIMNDPDLGNVITGKGMKAIGKCLKLKEFHLGHVDLESNNYFDNLNFKQLKSLTLCLSSQKGMNSSNIELIITKCEKLDLLKITGIDNKIQSNSMLEFVDEQFILKLPTIIPIKKLVLENVHMYQLQTISMSSIPVHSHFGMRETMNGFTFKFKTIYPDIAFEYIVQ